MKKFAMLSSAMAFAVVASAADPGALPVAVSPEAEGVSSAKLGAWLDTCEREIDCLHGFVLLRHGKVIAEGSWKPYDTLNEPHFLSSHTKCFTSTAIGLLADEGKIDLDERVVDILKDKLPPSPSENLRMLRVRDLMTMNFGAYNGEERRVPAPDGDWVKTTLASELDHRPGQFFWYDSGATHTLGLIAARRAGMPLFDFLKKRLFSPLGIEKAWTTVDPEGNMCAAWGLHLTTREIARMGQLHLQEGLWNGKRILSRQWVQLATAKQSWSGETPTDFQKKNDWHYGFGFNWWRCQHDCYRADGAGGQYTIVMPDLDAVLSIHADVRDMQQVLNVIWDKLLPALTPQPLPEDAVASEVLRKRCAALALKPVPGAADGAKGDFYGKTFAFDKAPTGISAMRIDPAKGGWTLKLTTVSGVFDIPVGCGEWKKGEAVFSARRHQPLCDCIGRQPLAASAGVQKDGSLWVRVMLLQGTRKIDLTFKRKFFKSAVEGEMLGLGKFSAKL